MHATCQPHGQGVAMCTMQHRVGGRAHHQFGACPRATGLHQPTPVRLPWRNESGACSRRRIRTPRWAQESRSEVGLLRAHEVLAELSDENFDQFGGLVEDLRSELEKE